MGKNLGALAVYGLWAELEITRRGLITGAPSRNRVKRIAQRQFDIMKANAGQPTGTHWLKPAWWGSQLHAQHHQQLEALYGHLGHDASTTPP